MRCEYCDHSDDGAGSIYNDSVHQSTRPGRVRYRVSVNKEVCDRCWEDSLEIPFEPYPEDVLPLLVSEWDETDLELPELPDDEDFN